LWQRSGKTAKEYDKMNEPICTKCGFILVRAQLIDIRPYELDKVIGKRLGYCPECKTTHHWEEIYTCESIKEIKKW
jgi:hypothetical protein